jgi:hypothetical protein
MNSSQEKPMTRSVGEAAFAREVLQWAKRVLALAIALWTRFCQAVDATQSEVVAASAGPIGVVKIDVDDNLGRAALIRFRSVMRDSRRPQRLFVPIASFDFESFGVTVRRIASHQRPPNTGVLSRSPAHGGIAASNAHPIKKLGAEPKLAVHSTSASPIGFSSLA